MRTTLAIDDALLERAKKRASGRGITLGEYVSEAVREHLVRPEPAPIAVTLPVFDGGGLRAGLDPSSNRALYEVLDRDGELRA